MLPGEMSQIVKQIYVQMLSKKYVYYSETQKKSGLKERVDKAQTMIDRIEDTAWTQHV